MPASLPQTQVIPTFDQINSLLTKDLMKRLTLRQYRFAVEYALNGGNGLQACKEAGYKQPDKHLSQQANQNLKLPYVSRAISYIQADRQVKTKYNRETAESQLAEAYALAQKLDKPEAMVSAVRQLCKIYGLEDNVGDNKGLVINISSPRTREVVSVEGGGEGDGGESG